MEDSAPNQVAWLPGYLVDELVCDEPRFPTHLSVREFPGSQGSLPVPTEPTVPSLSNLFPLVQFFIS